MALRVLTVALDLARPAAASAGPRLGDLFFNGALALVAVGIVGSVAWMYVGALRERRRLASWPRESAKLLVIDRVERPDEEAIPKEYEVALVLELTLADRSTHRVELKTYMDRHLFDYAAQHVRPEKGAVFVRVDPAQPGNVVLDQTDLWARKEQHDQERHRQYLEREAAAEREAEEKRQRVLRGD